MSGGWARLGQVMGMSRDSSWQACARCKERDAVEGRALKCRRRFGSCPLHGSMGGEPVAGEGCHTMRRVVTSVWFIASGVIARNILHTAARAISALSRCRRQGIAPIARHRSAGTMAQGCRVVSC